MKKSSLLTFFLIFSCLANALSALAIYFFGNKAFFMLGSKDAMLIFLLAVGFLTFRTKEKREMVFLLLMVLPLLFFSLFIFRGGVDLFAAIVSYRQVVTFYMLIVLGFLLAPTESDYKVFSGRIVMIGVVLVLFGLFERSTYFWSYFVSEYFMLKNIGVMDNGYPFVFIEPSSIQEFKNYGFLRMTSTFLDPINFAHFCVFMFFLSRQFAPKYKAVFLFGALFAFSKAAFLQLALIFTITIKKVPSMIKWILVPLLSIVGLYVVASTPGFFLHQQGLINGIAGATLLGSGFGTAGNVAAMYSETSGGVGDSFVGALAYQAGYVGLLFWATSGAVNHVYIRNTEPVISVLLLTNMALAFLSENSINFLSIIFPCVFCGVLIRLKCREGMDH